MVADNIAVFASVRGSDYNHATITLNASDDNSVLLETVGDESRAFFHQHSFVHPSFGPQRLNFSFKIILEKLLDFAANVEGEDDAEADDVRGFSVTYSLTFRRTMAKKFSRMSRRQRNFLRGAYT